MSRLGAAAKRAKKTEDEFLQRAAAQRTTRRAKGTWEDFVLDPDTLNMAVILTSQSGTIGSVVDRAPAAVTEANRNVTAAQGRGEEPNAKEMELVIDWLGYLDVKYHFIPPEGKAGGN